MKTLSVARAARMNLTQTSFFKELRPKLHGPIEDIGEPHFAVAGQLHLQMRNVEIAAVTS